MRVYVPVARSAPAWALTPGAPFVADTACDADGSRRWCAARGDTAAAGVWDAHALWDAPVHLRGHAADITSVRLFPSAQGASVLTVVLSTSIDMTARVFSALDGANPRTLTGHQRAVLCSAIIARGREVLTGSADSTVRLWDVGEGRTTAVLQEDAPVNALATDGAAAYVGTDGALNVWDLRAGAKTALAPAADVVSRDGSYVLAGARDGTFTLTEVRAGPVFAWRRAAAPATVANYAGHSALVAGATGLPCRMDLSGAAPAVAAEFSGFDYDRVDSMIANGERVVVCGATGSAVYHVA